MADTRPRLFDSHAHLVSNDDARYPRNPFKLTGGGGHALRAPFGPGTIGIPGGQHGPNPVNEKPTAEQMHKWMGELNVVSIAAVQKGMIYGTDNSYIVDAADLFPDEMRAIVILDPEEEKTLPEIRAGAGRGIVGVRYFPVNVDDKVAWFSSDKSVAVWALCDELGLAVDLEGPPFDADELIPVVESMADRFPKTPIVLDHLFMPDVTQPNFGIDSRFDGFAARKNIYYKWTSLIMDTTREQGVAVEQVLRRAVDFYGADQIMWGSDIGTSSGTYHEMVQRAIDSTALLNDEERRKVLHDTGRRVLMKWNGVD
ncbi:amidohydrolase family protein [Sphingobium nicotianae]|uniref:Amidohydrolase family protein n=1 Tax=Sphingobium nicotianae TaxID=2782607 RepID=A0A9X1IRC3_9SPHN|nr:amidohydrolase family protein [Sphingobium nicotianae]